MLFVYKLRDMIYYVALLLVLWIALHYALKAAARLLQGLYEPAQQTVDLFKNDVDYAVSYWTVQGQRPYQEDRMHQMKVPDRASPAAAESSSSTSKTTSSNRNETASTGGGGSSGGGGGSMYGVFDGHGGHRAAEYCRVCLLPNVASDERFAEDVHGSLFRGFLKTDEEFVAAHTPRGVFDGTTAIVALVRAGKVYVANAGDSRAVLVQRGGRVVDLSFDHKPSREDEVKRITDLGGRVIFWGRWRVEGVLAVSRGIGDAKLKPYVTCEPEVTEKELEEQDLFLVIASDGLWDVMQNEEVARIVMNCKNFRNAARDLCDEATLLGSGDNITVQVVNLKMPRASQLDAASTASTSASTSARTSTSTSSGLHPTS